MIIKKLKIDFTFQKNYYFQNYLIFDLRIRL